MESIKRGKGGILLYESYEYTRQIVFKNNNTLWKCNKRHKTKCKGSITVSPGNTLARTIEHFSQCISDSYQSAIEVAMSRSFDQAAMGKITMPKAFNNGIYSLIDQGIPLVGQNRVLYTDNIGKYFLDEYGHQIYYFDFGKKVCHLDCKGNYRQINEDDKYYYDRNGRYVLADDGEKNYQIAPCTSTYNLSHEDLLVKTTVDCGHSEKIRPNCRMQLKDPNLRKNVPSLEPLNIKETLLPEVAQYLWENVAHALPESLRHVGELHPRNPIHELAHSIVFNRYRKTKKETTKLEQEAKTCRERIMRCRDEKEIAQSEAWKRKQTQPCKPADTDNDSVYDAHVKRSEFIRTLISFDD